MSIRKHILFFTFILPLTVYSQKYDIDFYTLGILNDYLGRTVIKGEAYSDSLVEEFHDSRLYIPNRLMFLIDSVNKYNSEKVKYHIVDNPNNNKFHLLLSKQLTLRLNKYYDYHYTKTWTIPDSNKIYRGRIKKFKIIYANKIKQISYLSACFLVNGNYTNSEYYFTFGNSVNKYKIIKSLLNKNDCKIIKLTDNPDPNVAPRIRKIYFVPSVELKQIFDNELKYKKNYTR